jgi:hypothetical protein
MKDTEAGRRLKTLDKGADLGDTKVAHSGF